jgi:hypothetical protein
MGTSPPRQVNAQNGYIQASGMMDQCSITIFGIWSAKQTTRALSPALHGKRTKHLGRGRCMSDQASTSPPFHSFSRELSVSVCQRPFPSLLFQRHRHHRKCPFVADRVVLESTMNIAFPGSSNGTLSILQFFPTTAGASPKYGDEYSFTITAQVGSYMGNFSWTNTGGYQVFEMNRPVDIICQQVELRFSKCLHPSPPPPSKF